MQDVTMILKESLWGLFFPIVVGAILLATMLSMLKMLLSNKKKGKSKKAATRTDENTKIATNTQRPNYSRNENMEYGNIRPQSEYNQVKPLQPAFTYKGKFQRRYILTLNEKKNYIKIKEATDDLKLELFTKVRLADILEPKNTYKDNEWKSLFYQIDAKHVDFLVCLKNTMKMVCVIEIDDMSHEREDRRKRDEFVDFILKDVGIPTIRKLYVDTEELKKELIELI